MWDIEVVSFCNSNYQGVEYNTTSLDDAIAYCYNVFETEGRTSTIFHLRLKGAVLPFAVATQEELRFVKKYLPIPKPVG